MPMRLTWRGPSFQVAGCLALALMAPLVVEAQEPTVRVEAGRVWLAADGVPVRRVIEQWASASGVEVVGLESVREARITLHLTDVAEQQALELVLKDVAGYVLAERPSADGQPAARVLLVVPPTVKVGFEFAESSDSGLLRPIVLERLAGADSTNDGAGVERPSLPSALPSQASEPVAEVVAPTAAPALLNEAPAGAAAESDTADTVRLPPPLPSGSSPTAMPSVGELPTAESRPH